MRSMCPLLQSLCNGVLLSMPLPHLASVLRVLRRRFRWWTGRGSSNARRRVLPRRVCSLGELQCRK